MFKFWFLEFKCYNGIFPVCCKSINLCEIMLLSNITSTFVCITLFHVLFHHVESMLDGEGIIIVGNSIFFITVKACSMPFANLDWHTSSNKLKVVFHLKYPRQNSLSEGDALNYLEQGPVDLVCRKFVSYKNSKKHCTRFFMW